MSRVRAIILLTSLLITSSYSLPCVATCACNPGQIPVELPSPHEVTAETDQCGMPTEDATPEKI